MARKLTASYEEEHELQEIINLLGSKFHRVKRWNDTKGKYKKADIWLKD